MKTKRKINVSSKKHVEKIERIFDFLKKEKISAIIAGDFGTMFIPQDKMHRFALIDAAETEKKYVKLLQTRKAQDYFDADFERTSAADTNYVG